MSDLDALQATLADEHAALSLFGVYGARLSASATPGLFAAVDAGYAEHRRQRDSLEALIRDLDAEPVAAAVAYQITGGVRTLEEIVQHAQQTESECANRYAWLVAEARRSEVRSFAVGALVASAARMIALGADPSAFPGGGE